MVSIPIMSANLHFLCSCLEKSGPVQRNGSRAKEAKENISELLDSRSLEIRTWTINLALDWPKLFHASKFK